MNQSQKSAKTLSVPKRNVRFKKDETGKSWVAVVPLSAREAAEIQGHSHFRLCELSGGEVFAEGTLQKIEEDLLGNCSLHILCLPPKRYDYFYVGESRSGNTIIRCRYEEEEGDLSMQLQEQVCFETKDGTFCGALLSVWNSGRGLCAMIDEERF